MRGSGCVRSAVGGRVDSGAGIRPDGVARAGAGAHGLVAVVFFPPPGTGVRPYRRGFPGDFLGAAEDGYLDGVGYFYDQPESA
ncbi:hypothetical protein [Frankia sp. CiP1_Cm_nod1]|uniref:hypothetical protein n=1 Tax=Frankia sp. CiP1_Cm_nod1 TaxID=2897160 RepID=UPI002023C94A